MDPQQNVAPETGSRRILVVDDDEVMRDLLSTLLEVEGYAVVACSSGERALEALQTPPAPDVVLTDMQMPGLDGVELIRALRDALAAPAVLLGMSAGAPTPEALAQLDAFLPKPFDLPQLEDAVKLAENTRVERRQQARVRAALVDRSAAQPPDETVPVLDEAIVSALAKTLHTSQLRELYTLTLNDVQKRCTRMEAYAAEGDLAAVQREAHAVKGSCGMVGARELQSLATTLEGGTTLNTQLLKDFPMACDRLRRMLDQKFPHH